MNRQDIIAALQGASASKGFIICSEFSSCMGIKDYHRAKKNYLDGLEAVDGKYYLIRDVATVLQRHIG